MSRLTVITSLFNPAGYTSRNDNYRKFRAGIEAAGCDLITAELCTGDGTVADSIKFPAHDRNCLWQKEALLNQCLQRLPDDCEAVAWVDADILFQRLDWAEQSLQALKAWPIIQPWDMSFERMPDGTLDPRKRSSGWASLHDRDNLPRIGDYHPGYAWAARRDWLCTHGLFDRAVVGAGDILMLHAVTPQRIEGRDFSHLLTRAADEWAKPLRPLLAGRFGYVAGDIHHLHHGSRQHRQYAERQRALQQYRFDPMRHIERDAAGLWQWTEEVMAQRPEMVNYVRRYFATRREDEPPPPVTKPARPQPESAWTPDASVLAKLQPLIGRPIHALMIGTDAPLAHWIGSRILTARGAALKVLTPVNREADARFDARTRDVRSRVRRIAGSVDMLRKLTARSFDLIMIDADRDAAELLEALVLSRGLLRGEGQILITNIAGAAGEFVGGDHVTARSVLDAYQRITGGRIPITVL